jgi:molybdopterin molybdotransferase
MRRSSWSDARARSFAAAVRLQPESVPIDAAVGRVLASDVRALTDLPHYASSAMDGWAVGGAGPWRILRDATRGIALGQGDAVAIITGAVIPQGTRGILRSENAVVVADQLTSAVPDEPHIDQHIRHAGEEAIAGDVVIRASAVLNPAHVALAAICGHDQLEVVALPRVGFLFTGDEVVEHGIPSAGQVRDSFGPQLPAFVSALGGAVISRKRVGDDLAATIAALETTDGAIVPGRSLELLVTTGGTGSSSADHLRAALETVGADILIDGIAMRPGGPTMLARLPSGVFVVCLPGNPLAAMMGMLTVAQPLLAAMGGRRMPPVTHAITREDIPGRPGSTLLIPYAFAEGGAVPGRWRASGMMRGLADAEGVLVIPENGVHSGETAPALTLPWSSPL